MRIKIINVADFKKSLMFKSILTMILLGLVPLTILGIVSILNTKTNTVPIAFVVLMIISVLMIILFGLIVSKKIVLPIKMVINTFRDLQDGNIENKQRLIFKSKDEISELGNLFNSFIDAREDITLQKKLERKLNKQNRELHEAMEMLKDTQIQMVQQERLAAIGQLAAGVAHEINNPLGYVSGNADMLKIYLQRYEELLREMRRLMTDKQSEISKSACGVFLERIWQDNKIDMVIEDMPDLMNDITEGLKRIAAIVNGLRGFSRNNQMEGNNTYNLNEGIQTTLLVANNEIKYNCEVALELNRIPSIYVNGGQINQVLLNIIINAAHAIREKFVNVKGLITIKTYDENNMVLCSISDNGCGMSDEVKSRIFEPFYTTKPVGQGTGLGLGIAYDIICKQHDGSIDVKSSLGEGTCFTISLPIK